MALMRYQLVLVEVAPPQETVQRAPFTVRATVTFAPLPSVARTGAVVLGLVRTLTPAARGDLRDGQPEDVVRGHDRRDGRRQDRTQEREREQRGDGERSRTDREVGGDSQLGNLGWWPLRVADGVNPGHPTFGPVPPGPSGARDPTASRPSRRGRAGRGRCTAAGGRPSSRARRSRPRRPRRAPPPGAAAARSRRTSCSRGTRRRGSRRTARTGPSPVTGRALCTRSLPVGSARATTGLAGSRQAVAPAVTVTSAPRLPAAPPHGPPVTVRSLRAAVGDRRR